MTNPGEEVQAVERYDKDVQAACEFLRDLPGVARSPRLIADLIERLWADYESLRARAERAEEDAKDRAMRHEHTERNAAALASMMNQERDRANRYMDQAETERRLRESAERERDAANRALFQMQEAAKLLTGERDALVKDKERLDWIEREAMRCGVIEVCYYGWSEEDGTQDGAACIQFGIEEGSSIRTEIDAELLASTASTDPENVSAFPKNADTTS
jgi:hypothetical protein